MDFDRIMPSVSRLGEGNRAAKRQGVITRIMRVFEKYSRAAQKVIEYDQKEMRTVLQLPVNAAAKRRGVGGGAS